MSVYEELSETQQFASRVIADHARSTAFAIADGILPGNEGRNYVLRKIMRRAIYHGREHLGLTDLFFYKVCDFVVAEMREAYPELETQRELIVKIVKLEEKRFANTVTLGIERFNGVAIPNIAKSLAPFAENIKTFNTNLSASLAPVFKQLSENNKTLGEAVAQSLAQIKLDIDMPQLIAGLMKAQETILSQLGPAMSQLVTNLANSPAFHDAMKAKIDLDLIIEETDLTSKNGKKLLFSELAKLYDTYGMPRDLIRLGLAEQSVEFEEEDFNERFDSALQELQKQGEVGHTARKSQPSPVYAEVLEKVGSNKFYGYDATYFADSKVVAILDGETKIDQLAEGQQGSVVLDQTPFYAESGGQVGDIGVLVGSQTLPDAGGSAFRGTVADTFSPVAGLIIHKVTVEKGTISVGDVVAATVDSEKRDATRRNHTATHLVHAALREVLGTHVKQAGSVVGPSVLRFDFTHYQPMAAAEIAEVEDLVNRYILKNEPVNTNVMAIEEAMAGGAMALFGEKYGSAVRVLSVGDGIFSKELCGGTHVRATGDIGSFKITADEAIASGVRRIRAITGLDAFARFREDERLIDASLGALKTQRDNLPNAIERLQEELKKTRKEMDELKLKVAMGEQGSASSEQDETREIGNVKVLAKIVDGLDSNGTRQLSDTLLARLKSGVVVIGRSEEGKVGIIVRVSDDLTGKIRAGDIIREIAPIVGGRGGGKADMAEGGGTDPSKLVEAIDASYVVIERMLG